MKCFECGDVGHKRASCPHKARVRESEREAGGEEAAIAGTEDSGVIEQLSGSSEAVVAHTEAGMPSEPQEKEDVNNAEVES